MEFLNSPSGVQNFKRARGLIVSRPLWDSLLFLLALAMLLLLYPTALAEETGVTVEEAFETELGESMVCRFSSVHPAMTNFTLHLWLGLRNPYVTFQFPGLVQGASGLTLLRQASKNLERQREIIQQLRATPVPPEIRPLYEAVIGMFE